MANLGGFPDPIHMATDASFDSFIDSDLILDAHSPSLTPATPTTKRETKAKPTSLSSLPTRLSMAGMDRHTPSSPSTVNEYLNYPQNSASDVTNLTTSNSSSLHNLSFDFFDGSDNTASAPGAADNVSPDADMTNASTPSASHFSISTPTSTVHSVHGAMVSPIFGMNNLNDSVFTGINQAFHRTVDDMGHQPGHQQVHHHAHHQRSLSLKDVAPPPGMPVFMPHAFSSFGYPPPPIKVDPDMMHGMYDQHVPSPSTVDRQSPASSAVSSSLFDQGSPPREKKRRLTGSSGEGNKGGKAAAGKKNGNTSKRSRSNTAASKNTGANINANKRMPPSNSSGDLITEVQMPPTGTMQASLNVPVVMPDFSFTAEQHQQQLDLDSMCDDSFGQNDEDSQDGDNVRKPTKAGTKRLPPSASQVTESGMPFPVIDTSAKHSSLFVPPDTSGLTKREARLVKNRAAAFLSRQRKREQFEELEFKCQSLCRLVWKMWELGSAKTPRGAANVFADQANLSARIMQEEGAEVREVFDTVLALKGGSVAPTEDGQLQGAVAAGIKSANGKIIGDASSVVHIPSSAAQAAEEAAKELASMRAELDDFRKREACLQAELAQERAMRMKIEFEANQRQQEQQPFRGGGQHDLSLTVPAMFEEDEEGRESKMEQDDDETSNGKRRGRAAGNLRPSRTSRRLQRNGDSHSLAMTQASPSGGQRKAAGAALMMVLFSFALFGLPGGQVGRVGGIARAPGSSDDVPLGRVLGAPVVNANYGAEDEEEFLEHDIAHHLPPSSHLSVDDLFPPAQTMSDLLNGGEDGERRLTRSLRNVLGGSRAGESTDIGVDYKAFAKDLGSSLDWDMQGGFLVLGSDGEEDGEEDTVNKDAKKTAETDVEGQHDKPELKDAPTKLTLFVPAPDMSNSPEADGEDRFYDAPLAAAEAMNGNGDRRSEQGAAQAQDGAAQRELTQVEATRAALQVLRNHRVAREAAAFAASRRFNKQPSPSQRVRSPAWRNLQSDSLGGEIANGKSVAGQEEAAADAGSEVDEQEDDFSGDAMDASSSTADRIRGTDFYQLEFSLSGAKVRNVAELTRLFGAMRSKAE